VGQWTTTRGCVDYDVLAANPFTGEPLGSPRQSWTAAVTLDWLSFAVAQQLPVNSMDRGYVAACSAASVPIWERRGRSVEDRARQLPGGRTRRIAESRRALS